MQRKELSKSQKKRHAIPVKFDQQLHGQAVVVPKAAITDPESGGDSMRYLRYGYYVEEGGNTIHPEGAYACRFEDADKKARTGAPSSLARHDRGLTTVIGRSDKDASGQKIDSSTRSTFERLEYGGFQNTG